MPKRRSPENQDHKAALLGKPIGRRDFVVTATGILAAVNFTGCAGESITGANGTIDLTINGLHPAATSGGSALATPTAGGATVPIPIPAAGHQTASVIAGQWNVQYTAPSNHVLAPGEEATRIITVTNNTVTPITVNLISQGTVQVNVTGLTGSPADGGSATAQRTDAAGAAIPISISAAGTGSATAPTGTYTVTYSPPAGHTVAAGSTNPATGVVVGLGATGTAAFTVQPAATNGTISVTVTGLTGSPANGGSATAQRTDAAGSPVVISVSAAGSGSASVPAGTYTVTYSPPSGFSVAGGSTNPVTGLAVAVGATANTSFAVQVVSTAGLIFHSDWSTGIGTTDAIMRDTNKTLPWDARTGNTGILEVVAATGRDFPVTMANVLRVRRPAGAAPFAFCRISQKWPAPNVGESLFFRVYLRNEFADSEGVKSFSNHHPVQTDPTGPWQWKFGNNADGTFVLRFNLDNTPSPYNSWMTGTFPGTPLPKFATLRLEWRITRVTSTQYTVHARVYNSSNVLLYSEDGVGATGGAFKSNTAGTQETMKQRDGLLTIGTGDNDLLRNLEVGVNGGPTFTTDQFYFWGGVMVRGDNWCGPY
jgi:hypothetical protein